MSRLLCAATGLIFALLTPSLTAEDTAQELEKLKKAISGLQVQLESRREDRSGLVSELRKLETGMSDLLAQIKATEKKITSTRKQLAAFEKRQLRLEADLQRQEQDLEEQLRSAYLLGHQSKLKLLLNQEDPQQLTRLLAYYDYIVAANKGQLDDFTADLRELIATRENVAEQSRVLALSRKNLEEQLNGLQSLKDSRKSTLAKMDAEINSAEARLQRLAEERQELEQLLQNMDRELARLELDREMPKFADARGKMPWPVKGRLRNSFGSSRGQGGLSWQGVNIRAEEGAEVRAVHDGRVVYSDWLRGAGLLVIIDHGDGFMSLYANNQQLMKETGDWVSGGDMLATVGRSGGQEQPGLYFEIRSQGEPQDPVLWCNKRR